MPVHRRPRADATILGAATLFALAMGASSTSSQNQTITPAPPPVADQGPVASDLVGTWASRDGAKLKLAKDGSYERSIKGRDRVAHGRYRMDKQSLLLRDESGLTTVVTIDDGALDMAGHRLLRD